MDSGTIVRLQLWDTAGQERFRSISKLYYRGASAVILVYNITDNESFDEMGRWLAEVKEQTSEDVIIHIVGTKNDIAHDPTQRKIPFERCIAYIAENLHPTKLSTPPPTAGSVSMVPGLDSKRSSGFWAQELGWDCCHEVSAKDGEGIDEVFRVITRKLVEQKAQKAEQQLAAQRVATPQGETGQTGYFDRRHTVGRGSFRLGVGDKRRSWLGFPTPHLDVSGEGTDMDRREQQSKSGRCC